MYLYTHCYYSCTLAYTQRYGGDDRGGHRDDEGEQAMRKRRFESRAMKLKKAKVFRCYCSWFLYTAQQLLLTYASL